MTGCADGPAKVRPAEDDVPRPHVRRERKALLEIEPERDRLVGVVAAVELQYRAPLDERALEADESVVAESKRVGRELGVSRQARTKVAIHF
jgi:hypothetical protein